MVTWATLGPETSSYSQSLGFTSVTCRETFRVRDQCSKHPVPCSPGDSAGRALCAPGCVMWAGALVCASPQVLGCSHCWGGVLALGWDSCRANSPLVSHCPPVASTPAKPSGCSCRQGLGVFLGVRSLLGFFFSKLSIVLSPVPWRAWIKLSKLCILV